MPFTSLILVAVVSAIALAGAICDARTHKLPNRLTAPACLLGLVFHLIAGAWNGGWSGMGSGLLFSLGGFALGFGILFLMWLMGASGAGDVKMMGALGAWLGAKLTFAVFVCSAGFIALFTVAVITIQTLRRGWSATRRRYFSKLDTKSPVRRAEQQVRRRILPYGVPLAVATWCILGMSLWRGWIH